MATEATTAQSERELQTQERSAAPETGDVSFEKVFAEKGVDGLVALGGEEAVKAAERIRMLAEVPIDVASTAVDVVEELKATREKAEAELMAAKKKLFLALGKGEEFESAREKLEPLKERVEEAKTAEQAAAMESKREVASEPVETQEEVAEEASPDVPMEEGAQAEQPVAEATDEAKPPESPETVTESQIEPIPVPEAGEEKMEFESTNVEGAEAAAEMEIPAGRETPQEELELPEDMETAPGMDWGKLIAEERNKLEVVEQDYVDAQTALADFKKQREGALAPIEQKYVAALEAQLEMDRLASAQMNNQIALYDLNRDIEALTSEGKEGGEIDKLIQQRNAKDVHSRRLAEQYDAAVKAHDETLEDYESSLAAYSEQNEESQEAAVESEEEENVPEKRELRLTPEDEASFEARQAGVEKKEKKKKTKKEKNGMMKKLFSAPVKVSEKKGAGQKEKKEKKGFFQRFVGFIFGKK